MVKIFFLLTFTFFIFSCSNNSVRDYSSLKQKALEVPPEFELSPPVKKDESTENATSEDISEDTSEDIQDIILQNSETSTENEFDNSSLDEFIETNFGNES